MIEFDTRPNRDAEVALVGRSNVGKSTLMRELTGHSFDTGGKPGVTRSPNHYDWAPEDFVITDLPGFGFMSGVDEELREEIKTEIVHYLEEYADNVLVAILVVDGKSVIDIIDRHSGPDEIPYDVEMFHFLRDLDVPTVVAVNKMDKVDDEDERLDASVTVSASTLRGSSGRTRSHRSVPNGDNSSPCTRPFGTTSTSRSATICSNSSNQTFALRARLGKTLMKSTPPSPSVGRRPARSPFGFARGACWVSACPPRVARLSWYSSRAPGRRTFCPISVLTRGPHHLESTPRSDHAIVEFPAVRESVDVLQDEIPDVTDVVPRVRGAMGRDDHLVEPPQRRVLGEGFRLENVQRGSREGVRLERVDQAGSSTTEPRATFTK